MILMTIKSSIENQDKTDRSYQGTKGDNNDHREAIEDNAVDEVNNNNNNNSINSIKHNYDDHRINPMTMTTTTILIPASSCSRTTRQSSCH